MSTQLFGWTKYNVILESVEAIQKIVDEQMK